MKKKPEKGAEALTEREKEALKYVVKGLTNKQIAKEMGITHHTVKAFLSEIFTKLGGNSRTDLAIKALLFNIIEISPEEFEIQKGI